jgi:hypothetical protein
MLIIDYVKLELYTNNFGGTKLKRNYIWGSRTKKVEYHCHRRSHSRDGVLQEATIYIVNSIAQGFPIKFFVSMTNRVSEIV